MAMFGDGGTVDPVAPGRFEVFLNERFKNRGRNVINGGYSLAACVEALRLSLPHPDPLVVSASYLRPVAPGPAEVTVEIVREGRRFSVGQAELFQNGSEALRVVATFTDLSTTTGRTELAAAPPSLPPPEQCVERPGLPDEPHGLAGRIDMRWPELPGWVSGSPNGIMTSEFWMRPADGVDADIYALAALVDMAAPAVFELGMTATTTLELTVHLRGRPAPGWLRCRASTRFLINGLHDEDFEIWDADGQLVAQSRQLQLLA